MRGGKYFGFSALAIGGVLQATNAIAATDDVSASGAYSLQSTLAPPDFGGLFGNAIAMWHDTSADVYWAAIGAPTDDGVTGAVYVFEKAAADHEWHQQARIVASDAMVGDEFGFSVAIDHDTIAIGSPFHADDFFVGATYVFSRDILTGQWIQVSDPLVGGDANLGWAVALSGDSLAASEPRAERVYTFGFDGSAWSALNTLTPAAGSPTPTDFGYALAMDGDRLVVGAPFDSSASPIQGSAQTFVRSRDTHSPPGWSAEQVLRPAASDASGPIFGFSVALTGDTMVVGAPWENESAGAVHVFARDVSSGIWNEAADIAPKSVIAGDTFGTSVAIDGATLAIGSSGQHGNMGNVYVYTNSGSSWTLKSSLASASNAIGDALGAALALSGTELLTNAWRHGFVESFGQTGSKWTAQPPLSTNGDDDDAFGTAIAMSGNTAVVSAPRMPNGAGGIGAAMVFVRDVASGAWNWQATLSDSEIGDDASGYHRCSPVAIDGDTIAIGTPSENFAQGAVHVYARSHGEWSESATLVASTAMNGDQFGCAVAVDGNRIVVGAPNVDGTGAAFVFARSGSAWSQESKIEPTDLAVDDAFGDSVAILGSQIVVGAPFQNAGSGAAYAFAKSGSSWALLSKLAASDADDGDEFGATLALSAQSIVVGAPTKTVAGSDAQGRAYVFSTSGTGFTSTPIDAPTAGAFEHFASAVSIKNDVVAIGAREANSAFVFQNVGGSWTFSSTLTGDVDTYFGGAIAIDDLGVIVGAPHGGSGSTPGGRAYFFDGK